MVLNEINRCCSQDPKFLVTYHNDSTWTVCDNCFKELYFNQNIKNKKIIY